jgi:hypothetical protein
VRATGNVAAAERPLFQVVLGLLEHFRPKGVLVGEVTAMTVEVRAVPFRHRPGDTPAAGEIVSPVAAGRHGIGVLTDKGDRHAVGAIPERSPGRVRGFG